MPLNIIDESTLTVAGTSIGLSSASPTLAASITNGARQAIIIVKTAAVHYREDGDAATTSDAILYPDDILQVGGGDEALQILDKIRFIRNSSTSGELIIKWYNRERIATAKVIRGRQGVYDSSGAVIEKAEDAAHSSGDKGFVALGVRQDNGLSLVDTDGDYVPFQFDRLGGVRTGKPVFGEATLESGNNGSASWTRGSVSPLDQKSPTGWLANLYGGLQTGDDWGRINVPVDELPLSDFTEAAGISQWTYWMTNAETMGVNIVLWVHDPDDFSKRAEITQLANVAGLAKAAGWNKHILDNDTTQFFWYGENVTGSGLTAGTQYTLTQFLADVVFSTYTIYRVTIEFGWEASGTFEDAFVADLMLNGIVIPLVPDSAGSGRVKTIRATATSGAIATTLAPKTPFYDLVVALHINTAGTTSENLTANVDAGAGSAYDENLLTLNTLTNALTNLIFAPSKNFRADDEIDIAWANTENRTYGLTMTCKTV